MGSTGSTGSSGSKGSATPPGRRRGASGARRAAAVRAPSTAPLSAPVGELSPGAFVVAVVGVLTAAPGPAVVAVALIATEPPGVAPTTTEPAFAGPEPVGPDGPDGPGGGWFASDAGGEWSKSRTATLCHFTARKLTSIWVPGVPRTETRRRVLGRSVKPCSGIATLFGAPRSSPVVATSGPFETALVPPRTIAESDISDPQVVRPEVRRVFARLNLSTQATLAYAWYRASSEAGRHRGTRAPVQEPSRPSFMWRDLRGYAPHVSSMRRDASEQGWAAAGRYARHSGWTVRPRQDSNLRPRD